MSEIHDFELSAKQVEKIMRQQCFQACEDAFSEIRTNKKSHILIKATLKANLSHILKGELISHLK